MGRKRKGGEGTVCLRKDGRWEGRVVIGYDEKGFPKTKNVLVKTKGECAEKLKALKNTITPSADMSSGAGWISGMRTTASQLCGQAPRESTRAISGCTAATGWAIGPLNKLTTNDIQQFCTWMKTDGDSGSGLADSQVINCHSLCCRALEKVVMDD